MNTRRQDPVQIVPGLWCFEDTCNVYVFNFGGHGLAVDFGSGRWRSKLPASGITRLEHVLLTHHHADQCFGLCGRKAWPFAVHAPSGEEQYLSPAGLRLYYRHLAALPYTPYCHRATIPRGIYGISYDIRPDSEQVFFGHCFRFVLTPGHGTSACSIIVEFNGKQLAFCGDAAYAGGTIWKPRHLEWDHWTGRGALAAWEGVTRLAGIGIDLLLPAHGPPITGKPRKVLNKLAKNLLNFYRAKGAVCAGEKDRFLIGRPMRSKAVKILPHLYMLGNSYLLVSDAKKGLVVDPAKNEMQKLEALLEELGDVTLDAAIVSHCHADHCDGLPYLQRRHKITAWVHPRPAEKLWSAGNWPVPYLAKTPILPDRLLPRAGAWRWCEYLFSVAPWPGQTWWHAVHMAEIDGQKVLFGGDSFQPASRWNGTGGFCALNNSRFREGFIPSARLALKWRPDIVANGHGAVYYFSRSRFNRIVKWAQFAGKALRAVCPTGNPDMDYYPHDLSRAKQR